MGDRKRGKYVSKMRIVSMPNEAIFIFLGLFVVFFNDSHYFLNPIIIDIYLFSIRLEIHYHFCHFIYALPFLSFRSSS